MSALADQARDLALELESDMQRLREMIRTNKAAVRDPVALEILTNLQAELLTGSQRCAAIKSTIFAARSTGYFQPPRSGKMAAAGEYVVGGQEDLGAERFGD